VTSPAEPTSPRPQRDGRTRKKRRTPTREQEQEAVPRGMRQRAKRTLVDVIKQIPAYLKLLGGLLTDRRVAGIDKLLVAGAIVYILSPMDLLPDFIPFLGEVDDVYLLMLSLQRLIVNAGRRVVSDYWVGDMSDLSTSNLRNVVLAATFFLPRRMRRRLRTIGRV
jgi:uncharacterized membrane protein YkvA (DUF1232 family)